MYKIDGKTKMVILCLYSGAPKSLSHFSLSLSGKCFFHFMDLNSRVTCNLTLCKIIEIVFMFVIKILLIQVAELTGRFNKMIIDWYNLCHEVCTAVI